MTTMAATENAFNRQANTFPRFQREEALAKQALETCAERLYPHKPSPPLPAPVPLANHTGQYRHIAYGDIFVSLQCSETANSPSATPSPGAEGAGCQLQTKRQHAIQGQFVGKLQHQTGEFWVTRVYLPELPDEVQACLRTQFEIDATGVVSHVGVDLRLEEEDAPLVWFERVG